MGDAVRDVAEQELLAAGHPDAPHDDHVCVLAANRVDDCLRRVVGHHDRRASAFPGEVARVLGQLSGSFAENPVVGEQHAEEKELGLVALRHVVRESDGALGRLGAVGGDQDAANGRRVVRPAAQAHQVTKSRSRLPAAIGSKGGVGRREGAQMDVIAGIDAARERWNVLEHPFYTRWEQAS